ncbi:MAG: hypothetical protein ABIS27_14545 [Longimicrobiales bacterium]
MKTKRDGVVLLLALLCLLALEVTAVGLHFIAQQELRVAGSSARDLELRLAAQSAAARAVAQWPAEQLDSMGLHLTIPVPAAGALSTTGIRSSASIERLAPHLFLVRATAVSPLLESSTLGLIVATTTAAELAAEVTAAVRSNGAIHVGAQSRVDWGAVGCRGAHALEVASLADLDMAGGALAGPVASADSGGTWPPNALGSLTIERLAELARASAALASPVSLYEHDVTLSGSAGNGILVVLGDLALDGGTFVGIVMVRGALSLTGGATIQGAVLVDGGPLVLDDATVTFDSCAITASLDQPRLLGPFRPRSRRWIPLF